MKEPDLTKKDVSEDAKRSTQHPQPEEQHGALVVLPQQSPRSHFHPAGANALRSGILCNSSRMTATLHAT